MVGLAAALYARDDPSLLDQAHRLYEVEPYTVEGLTLRSWTREGVVVRAAFEGDGIRATFELELWPSDAVAFEEFRRKAEDVTGDVVRDARGREPCARRGATTTCVAYDGYRTFEATATTSPLADEELDACLLIRTARKHWYRVMDGYSGA